MDILKALGLKDKDLANQNKPDPHADGGCCGSCGGQRENNKQEQGKE